MSTNPFGFSVSMGTPPPAADPTRLIARPFEAFPAAGGNYLAMPAGGLQPHELPQRVLEALALCDAFRPSESHAQAIAARHGGWRSDPAGLRSALTRLRQLGLLVSEDELAAELAGAGDAAGDAPPLDTLFIRTFQRPKALRRLLASIAEAESGALRQIVVVDDSRGDEHRRRSAAAIADSNAGSRYDVHHVTRPVRRRIARRLASDDASRRLLETWLVGAPGADQTLGAVVNTALLLGAGQRFGFVDDDATFSAYNVPEGASDGPRFEDFQLRRYRVEADDRALRSQCPPLQIDPLARHADHLGATLGSISAGLTATQRSGLFDGFDPGAIASFGGGSRVRMTVNGVLGDPGTLHSLSLLYGPFEDLARLASDAPRFAERLRSGRVARFSPSPALAGSIALMTTTLTGIDGRDLLPPTPPSERGEDLFLGVAMAWVHPGSLFMDLPFMLAHRPDAAARPGRGEVTIPRRVEFATILSGLMASRPPAVTPDSPQRRMATLAALMGELADIGDDEAAAMIAHQVCDTRADLIHTFASNLQQLRATGDVARIFTDAIEAQRRFGDEDVAHCRAQVQPLREAARFQAEGLDCWCRAWREAAGASVAELVGPPDVEAPQA